MSPRPAHLRPPTLLGALCLAVCALLLAVAPAFAAFPGVNGRLAVAAFDNGDWDIYSVDPATGVEVNLTDSPNREFAPAWSPDGKRIAFARERSDPGDSRTSAPIVDVWTMAADGSDQVRVTSLSTYNSEPDFSPDGKRIVFVSRLDTPRGALYTMSADGTGPMTRVTRPGAEGIDHPAWSPSGDRIAFVAATNDIGTYEEFGGPDRDPGVHTINVDGTDERELTNQSFPTDARSDGLPDWAPDASDIVYQQVFNGGTQLLTPKRGTIIRRPGPPQDSSPAWAPDGSVIAFVRQDDTGVPARSALSIAAPVLNAATTRIPSPYHERYGELDWQSTPVPAVRPRNASAVQLPTQPTPIDAVSPGSPGFPVLQPPAADPTGAPTSTVPGQTLVSMHSRAKSRKAIAALKRRVSRVCARRTRVRAGKHTRALARTRVHRCRSARSALRRELRRQRTLTATGSVRSGR